MHKSCGVGGGGDGGWVAWSNLVSAQGPLVLGFWVWGLGAWCLGLTILDLNHKVIKSLSLEFRVHQIYCIKYWNNSLQQLSFAKSHKQCSQCNPCP